MRNVGGDTPPLQPESLRRVRESDARSAFSERLQQFAQTPRGRVAIDFARGHIEHELFPFIGRQLHLRQQAVALQKYEAGSQRGSFVAVDEGVIAAKVKQICRRDLDRIGDERLPHHRGLGRGHGGFE